MIGKSLLSYHVSYHTVDQIWICHQRTIKWKEKITAGSKNKDSNNNVNNSSENKVEESKVESNTEEA